MEEIEFLCDSRFLIALAEEETKSIEKAEEEVGRVNILIQGSSE